MCTKFHQNRRDFLEDMTNTISVDCIWKGLQSANDLQGHSKTKVIAVGAIQRTYTISY